MTRYLAAPLLVGALMVAPENASARSGFSFGFHSGPAYYPAPIYMAPPPPVMVVRPAPIYRVPVCAYPRPMYGGNSFHFSYFRR